MNNHSLTLSLLFAFTCLLPASAQAHEFPGANANCSGGGPAEILSLQPDGKVITSILVVAVEPTTPVTVYEVPAVVPVSMPQHEIQSPVYPVPVETFYPIIQPQAAVCTSGG